MSATRKCLTERQISAVVAAVLDGLLFLHRRKILHRDIKAANILLTRGGGVKLGDFGVATRLSSSFSARHTLVGTAPWLAPEVVVGTSALLARHVGLPAGCGYGRKADVWSLGITIIEMGDGQPPLGGATPQACMFFIPSSPPPTFESPDRWSPALNAFLSRALVKAPTDRASVDELLLEPFCSEFGRSSQQGGELPRLVYRALPDLARMRREQAAYRREREMEGARRLAEAARRRQQQDEEEERRQAMGPCEPATMGSMVEQAEQAEAALDDRTRESIRLLAQQMLMRDALVTGPGSAGQGANEDVRAGGEEHSTAPWLAGAPDRAPDDGGGARCDLGATIVIRRDDPHVPADEGAGLGLAVAPHDLSPASALASEGACRPAVCLSPALERTEHAMPDDVDATAATANPPSEEAAAEMSAEVPAVEAAEVAEGAHPVDFAAAATQQPPGLVSQGTLVVHESRGIGVPMFLRRLHQLVVGGSSGSGSGAAHERRVRSTSPTRGGMADVAHGASPRTQATSSTGAADPVGGGSVGGRGRNQKGRGQQLRTPRAIEAERAALERERLKELERLQRKFSKREEELAREQAKVDALQHDGGAKP